MLKALPRVAAVHDLSCVGRCSLTVIIPILSCLRTQVCPLPTALLSTHLGGFSGVAFSDLTKQLPDFFAHWKTENLAFDCIYSGFLASADQIDVVSDFIDQFSDSKPLVLVDPVMGDHGRLYSVYTQQMQEQMIKLIRKADIITPNYTEACFLLGKHYAEQVNDASELRSWLVQLAESGPSRVIITGVPLGRDQIMNIGYERESGSFCEISTAYIPVRYPGTGDIFASVLLGGLLNGKTLPAAMQTAADFVSDCIRVTFHAQTPVREGVLLEAVLPQLCDATKREVSSAEDIREGNPHKGSGQFEQ